MSRNLVKPELLAPAGNMEKGKMACCMVLMLFIWAVSCSVCVPLPTISL